MHCMTRARQSIKTTQMPPKIIFSQVHILRWGDEVDANTPIDFLLTITRKGSHLEIITRYTDHGDYDRSRTAKQIDILATAPDFNYTFNTAAFLLGRVLHGDRAAFEDIKVTVSR